MRPNSRAHDPFAPHRAAPAVMPQSPRRRGGRRKRTQTAATQPERLTPSTPEVAEPVTEPVEIPRATEAEPEASEQAVESE
jgi:hypothetical protein